MSAKGCPSTAETDVASIKQEKNLEPNQQEDTGKDGEDSLLNNFFDEIERLTIDDQDNGECYACNEINAIKSKKGGRNSDHVEPRYRRLSTLKKKQKERKLMIDQVESNKNNWKQFTITESQSQPKTTPQLSFDTKIGRPPISFSLRSGKNKKSKNTSKQAGSKITRRKRNDTEVASLFSFDDESPASFTPTLSACRREWFLPRWIAVLDTCAILESYESVCDMIQLARMSSTSASRSFEVSNAHQHYTTTASATHATIRGTASMAPRQELLFELLTIVVPYTVWDELDYRCKEIDDEHQRYKARRAVRMLIDELRTEQQNEDERQRGPVGGINWELPQYSSSNDLASMRCQSRIESHEATHQFVALSTNTKLPTDSVVMNDDKILACALRERSRWSAATAATHPVGTKQASVTAGGVVLITMDKILSGKACADRLAVDTPCGFVKFYNKRMASLRSRAATTRAKHQE